MKPEVVGRKVKELLENNNMTIEEFSEKMNLTIETLQKKLEGKEEFYLDEMIKIREIFQLDVQSCEELFFNEN